MKENRILEETNKAIDLFEVKNEFEISNLFYEQIKTKLNRGESTPTKTLNYNLFKLVFLFLILFITFMSFIQLQSSSSTKYANTEIFLQQFSNTYYLQSDSYLSLPD